MGHRSISPNEEESPTPGASPSPSWPQKASRWLPSGFLIAMCTVVLAHALSVTASLTYPYDLDQFRDIGIAQAFLDGQYPSDYLFRGEMLAYPPLTGALIALASALSNAPAPAVDVTLGPWLNLLIPISFYLLAAALAGRWTALAASTALLFVIPVDLPAWGHATYSPWLFSPLLGLTLFHFTLLAFLKAICSRRSRWMMGTGALLGLTFLAHPAPAVLLGCIMLSYLLITRFLHHRHWVRMGMSGQRLLLLLAMAFAASLPLTVSILFHYRLHTVNRAPSEWVWSYLDLEGTGHLLREWLTASSTVAAIGLLSLLRSPRRRRAAYLVGLWTIISGGFLAYSFVWQAALKHGLALPHLVPGYHFLLYLTSAKALLYGYGLVAAARAVLSLPERMKPGMLHGRALRTARALLVLAGIAGTLVKAYPRYPGCFDLTRAPRMAQEHAAVTSGFAAYEWLLSEANPADVFLCSDRAALLLVAPAARKAVCTAAPFTSPYVNYQARAEARAALFEALARHDAASFKQFSGPYKVSHVILDETLPDLDRLRSAPFLAPVFSSPRMDIYRIMGPPGDMSWPPSTHPGSHQTGAR